MPLVGFANRAMKVLACKIQADLATARGIGATAPAVDLLLKTAAAPFLMSEDNGRAQRRYRLRAIPAERLPDR